MAEPKQSKQKTGIWGWLGGTAVGVLSGLFGSGGGVVAVPLLKAKGLDAEKAHATSLSITLPLAVLSGLLYRKAGAFTWSESLDYWPGGLLGALCGALLLPHMKARWLRRVFGAVLLLSAGRLFVK